MVTNLATALPQIANELLTRLKLCPGRLIAIKIADQANPERNIIEVIAVHVTSIDLTPPPIADFDLSVTRRSAVADHEMVGETVLHVPNMPMIVIKHSRVALPRSAVMHDDELPRRIPPVCRRAIDLSAD